MRSALDRDALLEAAATAIPDADFGGDEFLPALDQLLAALREQADLEAVGEWAAAVRIVTSLERRRQLSQLLARTSEITTREITAPIFILGFPRTGTTLLHNLLAADPNKRAIRLWEMREPFAPVHRPNFDEAAWSRSVIATTEQLIEAGYRLSPRLADIHPLRASWPDECSWLFRNSFCSMVFGFSYFVPSYVAWLSEHDMAPAYAYFALQLQAITQQRGGGVLVLKDPCHLWHIDALLGRFPDARIIQLHRPIEQIVGSFASLCRALQEGGARLRPSPDIGRYAVDMLATAMERMLVARSRLAPGRVLDLDYHELVTEPVATLERIHDRFGLPFSDAAREGAEQWLVANRGLAGRHRYELAEFGLEPEQVARRFADYGDWWSSRVEVCRAV